MWETLYDDFWDKLVRFCARMTRDEAGAEDLAQETLLRARQREALLAALNAAQQKSWRFETAHNLFCDQARRAAREQALLARLAPAGTEEGEDDTALAALGGVELAALLGRLDAEDRALFALRYEAGYTAVEIAGLRGQPPATVRTRLHRIRKELQDILTED